MKSTKKRKGLFSWCIWGSKNKKKVKPENRYPNSLIESNLERNSIRKVSNLNEKIRKKTKTKVPNSILESYSILPPMNKDNWDKKTLILDLDETWAHSSFGYFKNSNFKRKIKYEGNTYTIHVLKRPHLDDFLERMSKLYEIVFYTASVEEYANLVIDYIDPNKYGSARVFREDWKQIEGSFVKDLTNLGRDLTKTVIIDNSPIAYCLNPCNGLPIKSFYDDIDDEELLYLIPILEHIATVENVQNFIKEQVESLDCSNDIMNVSNNCNNVSFDFKMFDSGCPEPLEKYGSDEVETFKNDINLIDKSKEIADFDESKGDEQDWNVKNVEKYSLTEPAKPSAMLARYNEMSQMHKPSPIKTSLYKREFTQFGQGMQNEDESIPKFRNLKINLKKPDFENKKANYKSVDIKKNMIFGFSTLNTKTNSTTSKF
jgi:carboxy-terminal domain RNA polymerase II polypeptide A small phosphatase